LDDAHIEVIQQLPAGPRLLQAENIDAPFPLNGLEEEGMCNEHAAKPLTGLS